MTVQELASRPHRRSAGTRLAPRLATELGAAAAVQTEHGQPARFEDLTFESHGVRCTAWRWWPEGADGAPCVVLAYGYSGPSGPPPTAESVADARLVRLPEQVADAIGSVLGQAPCPDAGRFLTTVLITDIVDSTGLATRLGDRRWREALADHYTACRSQVERHAGELVNTTGDGIVAIFDSPTRAVRAAMEIQALAGASGIAVRAGLHTGECERLDDGLAGVAVHIAARVCALGCADDVMTTGTVRDLVTGSMLAFEPRGHHELRGVRGSWPVFSATDPD
jgi:class 3 adenylate cyclase